MKIKDIICDILQQMQDDGYFKSWQYNDDYRANVEWGELETPTAQFHCVTDRSIDIADGIFNEQAKILVFFGEKCYMEEDGESREEKIERMMDVAQRFISNVMQRSTLSITTDKVIIYSIYEFADSGVTGVNTDFEVVNLQGECL